MSKNNNYLCKQPHRAHTTQLRRKKLFRISIHASHSSHCFIEKKLQKYCGIKPHTAHTAYGKWKNYSMFENSLKLLTLLLPWAKIIIISVNSLTELTLLHSEEKT